MVELAISSDVRWVDLAHATAERMAEAMGLDGEARLNVGLAVREAVVNAITHGNHQDPRRKVTVEFRERPDALEITVSDEGSGFDAAATPDPTSRENLLRSSGRGLHLIHAFVDEVRFARRDGNGMEVTLVKKLGPAAAKPA